MCHGAVVGSLIRAVWSILKILASFGIRGLVSSSAGSYDHLRLLELLLRWRKLLFLLQSLLIRV